MVLVAACHVHRSQADRWPVLVHQSVRSCVLKSFACGDVVPGCDATFVCDTEDEILSSVATHAAHSHGLTAVPVELVSAVRAAIVSL